MNIYSKEYASLQTCSPLQLGQTSTPGSLHRLPVTGSSSSPSSYPPNATSAGGGGGYPNQVISVAELHGGMQAQSDDDPFINAATTGVGYPGVVVGTSASSSVSPSSNAQTVASLIYSNQQQQTNRQHQQQIEYMNQQHHIQQGQYHSVSLSP